MNSIQKNESSSVPINNNDHALSQFKSIYYLLKGKRDTDIKLFDDNKKFSYSDILELNDKVNKKLELHQKVTNMVSVTVALDNKAIKSFGNWEEFVNTDWNISAKTKYITLEWDFNIILPNHSFNIPQTHTLRIRIGNNLKPSEMIQVVFQGAEEYDLAEVQSEMVCKIDFVNAQICSELKNVVSEWYDALCKNTEKQKFIHFIRKNHDKIQALVIFFFLTAGIILSNYLFILWADTDLTFLTTNATQKLFASITWSMSLMYIFFSLGNFYAERIHKKTIHKFRGNPMFDFTKGDSNKLKEVTEQNQKLIKKLFLEIFCSISANLIAYLVGFFLNKIF